MSDLDIGTHGSEKLTPSSPWVRGESVITGHKPVPIFISGLCFLSKHQPTEGRVSGDGDSQVHTYSAPKLLTRDHQSVNTQSNVLRHKEHLTLLLGRGTQSHGTPTSHPKAFVMTKPFFPLYTNTFQKLKM